MDELGLSAGGAACFRRHRRSRRRSPFTTSPNSDPSPVLVSAVRATSCLPAGVVSTMFPSPALVVRMLPLGAITSPRGCLRCPPSETVAAAGVDRGRAGHRLRDRGDPVVERIGEIQRAVARQRDACRADHERCGSVAPGDLVGDHLFAEDLRRLSGPGCRRIRSTVELSDLCARPAWRRRSAPC